MSDVRQTVTRKDVDGIDDDGQVAHQTMREVHTESSVTAQSTVVNIVWFIYGIIGILLVARFLLLALGANSANGFVSFIYSVSRIFSSPFDSIFNAKTIQTASTKSTIEPSIIVAIVVYAIIAWGLVRLATINSRRVDV